MNKKVSTIFAMAALMGGSLFSSAYADELSLYVDVNTTIEDKDISGDLFLKVGTDLYLGSDWTDDTKSNTHYFAGDLNTNYSDLTKETLNKYLWTVSKTTLPGAKAAYSFVNKATGEAIRVDINKANDIVTAASKSGDAFETLFSGDGTNNAYQSSGSTFSLAADAADKLAWDENNNELVIDATGDVITIQKLLPGIEVTDPTVLNELYNSAGFNFELDDEDLANVSNLFNEKTIVALNVPRVTEKTDYAFPAGTYFATSTPGKWNNSWNNAQKLDYLLKCTFIAVDSDVNIAEEADDRKAGNGFTLTEVSGRDLVLYTENDDDYKAQGNQISVYNACFKVEESTTKEDVYALSLNKIRYVEVSSSNAQKEVSKVRLTADEDASGVKTVIQDASVFLFKFAESTVVKAADLLFKGDTAAIYNIRFYQNNGNDESVNGKYLTTSATGDKFIATGLVISDLDVPAYQWVISGVDGNDVTFTNRETQESLTTKLFDEGNGRYSLAFNSASNNETQFNYYNVNQDGDVVVGKKADGSIDTKNFQGSYVELLPVDAATYAGYLNVDDKTVMTLSFGRDIAPTSNKLYPVAEWNTRTREYEIASELTGDVADAAQWRVIKSVNNNHPVRCNYVYANGDLINTKTQGDVVYAYTYQLQLIVDGRVIDGAYLNNTASSIVYNPTTIPSFYIQENVDGSVYIKNSRNAGTALLLDNWFIRHFA